MTIGRCVACGKILTTDRSHIARRNNDPEWLADHCAECNRIYLESLQRSSGLSDGMNRFAADLFGMLHATELMHQRSGSTDIQDAYRSLEMAARKHLGYDAKRNRRSQRKKAPETRAEDQLLDLQDESNLRRDLLNSLIEVPGITRQDWLAVLGITFQDWSILIRFYDTCANYPAKYLEYSRGVSKPNLMFRPGSNIIQEVMAVVVADAIAFLRYFRETAIDSKREMTRV
jgi:hypothetical protein